MMIVAKMENGKIVQIVKVQHEVGFSQDKDWVFVCFDFDKIFRRREQFKWIPAARARFTWVREFIG